MDLEADGNAYELGLDAEAAAEDAEFQAEMAASVLWVDSRDVDGLLLPNFSAFRPPRLSQGGAAGQRAGQSPAPTSRCACWILLACDGTAVQMFRRLPMPSALSAIVPYGSLHSGDPCAALLPRKAVSCLLLSSCYPLWIQRLVRCPSQTHCCA